MSLSIQTLQQQYLYLINNQLPAIFSYPVKYNHCFARIILDWICNDCWYHHLPKIKPAYKQLTPLQLRNAIERMQQWIATPSLLVADNIQSLSYRKKK